MARLKVKQISDFTTEVQSLIDNDSDQNALLISNNKDAIDKLEDSVDSLELIAGGTIVADLGSSIDSLDALGMPADITAVTNIAAGNAVDIGALQSFDTNQGVLNSATSLHLAELNTSVNELQVSVNSLEALAGGTIVADLSASIDSLDTLAMPAAIASNATAIAGVQSDVDQNEIDADAAIAALQADVDGNEADADSAIAAVQADVDGNEADADAAIAALQADVDGNEADADASFGFVNASIDDLQTDVAAILSGASANADSFAEIVTLINSVDTANDNAFAAHVLAVNASVDELQSSVTSLELAAGGTIVAELSASIDSLDALDLPGDISTNASGISTNVSNISTNASGISTNVSNISTNASGISTNASAISSNDSDISSLQTDVTQLKGDSTYIHEYAAFASATQFRCTQAVEHASDDDMQVFINGHAIGRVRTVSVDGVDTKYGWEHNSNNTTFDLHNIGYDLESSDVVYVVSHG